MGAGRRPLLNLALTYIPFVDSYKKVNEYWIHLLGWNWDALAGLLPAAHIANTLSTIFLFLRMNMESSDALCWHPTHSGEFSIPQRMRSFIWLLLS